MTDCRSDLPFKADYEVLIHPVKQIKLTNLPPIFHYTALFQYLIPVFTLNFNRN